MSEVNKTKQVLDNIKSYMANRMGMLAQYKKWDKETAIYGLDQYIADSKNVIPHIDDIKQLSYDDLKSLGFGIWDARSDKTALVLIPIYLLPWLHQEDEIEEIDGEITTIAKADDDVRFGCIAGGFRYTLPDDVFEKIGVDDDYEYEE